jgi:hypothetical protein
MGILALIFPPLPTDWSSLLTYSPNLFQIPAKANNCRFRTCYSLLCHHSLLKPRRRRRYRTWVTEPKP